MPTQAPPRPSPVAARPPRSLHSPSASPGGLRAAHRRVSITRIGVWAALAAGPLALAGLCAVPRTVVSSAQPKTIASAALRSDDPGGVAALFTDLWLRSDAASASSSTAQALDSIAPDVDLPARSGDTAAQVPLRTVAVHSARQGDGSWSVVVAAQFTVSGPEGVDGTVGAGMVVRYFAVPVVSSGTAQGAGAFTVTAAPAEVAGPAVAAVPASPLQNPLPADAPLVSSVGEFFQAYLGGVGEVDRYLSPGTALRAVHGSGYGSVVVDQVVADSDSVGGSVPGDGTAVRVQVHVGATDAAGTRWPLVYGMTLTARSGRWEVTALEVGGQPTGRPGVPSSADSDAAGGGASK